MEEGLNGEGKSVRDSPVPAKRKTADDDDDDEDEKDSEMTLNTYRRDALPTGGKNFVLADGPW